MNSSLLPAWLEGKSRHPGQGAYEGLEPGLRGKMKEQISALYALYGKEPDLYRHTVRHIPPGLEVHEATRALDWCVFLLDASYSSASGLIAALIPALMAGVAEIIICRIEPESDELALPLSAALELLGIEQVYSIHADEAIALCAELSACTGLKGGKIVAMGSEHWPRSRLGALVESGVNTVFLPARIIVAQPSEKIDVTGQKLFLWMQPQAKLQEMGISYSSQAVLGSEAKQFLSDIALPENNFVGLSLENGCEHIWCWAELSPAVFCKYSLGVFKIKGQG